MGRSPSSAPLLSVHGVSKHFGRVQALADVDLRFHAGEIHAILGENGAGKSTLMNAIYGLIALDAGTVRMRGDAVRFRTPSEARRAGIGMVHQDFALVDALSVAENLALGLSRTSRLWWNRRRVCDAARRLAGDIGFDLGDLDAPAGSLAVGARQRLEIVKALAHDPTVLILDEPTAVLTPAETAQLFRVLQNLRSRGTAILFITHKLREVMEVADRVTVMRRGRVVAEAARAEVTPTQLAGLMVGALPPARNRRGHRAASDGSPQLRIECLSVAGERGPPALRDVNLEVRAGEIFGIAGVDGNGQSELFEVLTGLRRPAGGTVVVGGHRLTQFHPAAAIAAGIAHVPPDRRRQSVVGQMSLRENAVLNRVLLRRLARGPFLHPAASRRVARELVERYAIVADSLEAPATTLSGGNLQRLIVARALAVEPRLLVAFNPTRGLDVAAARAVYDAFDAALQRGAAVLLISTDLDEILEMSDRVAVLYRGCLSAALHAPVSTEQLGLMMAGAQ